MALIQKQRKLIEELTAQTILCMPADYPAFKAKLDIARRELEALESAAVERRKRPRRD
jgi:hypothetical protein